MAMGTIRKLGDNMLNSNKFIYTFLRSAASSQTASWVDMLLGFALFAWLGLAPWLSTAIGAVAGGIINCIINYRFTFHAQGCPWRAVAVKYGLVWFGSLLLNTFGTQLAYTALDHWPWLETMGFNQDGCYAAARLGVSLAVSWFWNFVMQRYFVYRPSKFDPYAVKFTYKLFGNLGKKSEQDETTA